MSINPLPAAPSLENLRKKAKSLYRAARRSEAEALSRIGPYFGDPAKIQLTQAQLVLAREYGFTSWRRLKQHVEAPASDDPPQIEQIATRFLDLVCLHYGSQPDRIERFREAAALLEAHPTIAAHSIHTAAAVGDAAAVVDWLDRDPTLVEAKGGFHHWTPLMYAAYARPPGASTWPVGWLLLSRGADPNAHYMWGGQYRFTALTGVFGQGEGGPANLPEHPDCEVFARALLEAGADPNDGQAAYNRCFEPGDLCFSLLLEYGLKPEHPLNWLEEPGGAAQPGTTMGFHLINAIRRGFLSRVRLLLDHGADPNLPDNTYDNLTKGRTPLAAARLLGETEIAGALLAAGAEPDELHGIDAMQAALMAGNLAEAQAALETQPDLRPELDARAAEMLDTAANAGNHAALRAMIGIGLDLSSPGKRGPLHAAAWNGDIEIAKLLIAAGADPSLRDPDHDGPPIGWALHSGQLDMVAFLEGQKIDIFTAAARGLTARLAEMLDARPEELERRFVSVRARPDKPAQTDWLTPLAVAVVNGQAEAVALLLERGADAAAGDSVGDGAGDGTGDGADNTILSAARQHGGPAVLALIEAALPD
ncbi:MAG: ankyrin repeat domain-containing protein [Pseudomonadota bacterium]